MQSSSSTTPVAHGRAGPRRLVVLLACAGLLVAACGTNAGTTAPGAAAAPGASARPPDRRRRRRRSAPPPPWAGRSPSGRWATRASSSRTSPTRSWPSNPGYTVNVTPVDWGQAVAKLQTAIAGNQTPDVSQMGTDMMGQFAATGAFETVPANFDPATFFESAWNTNVVDGAVSRRALVRRDQAPLLPHRHRREGRHHGPARDVGRPDGDGQGDAGQGRRQVRHLARDQELAGVPAVPVVERRRRHGRPGQVHARTARRPSKP